jgi:hypothetical protein
MVYHYLPLEEVKALYPKAIITSHPSYQNAINAVAFDQADVFLGDTISTHYMIKGYLNNIRMANFGKHEAHGFSFAVHKNNPELLASSLRRSSPSLSANEKTSPSAGAPAATSCSPTRSWSSVTAKNVAGATPGGPRSRQRSTCAIDVFRQRRQLPRRCRRPA